MTILAPPRPWYPDGDLTPLARARWPRRHESPMRWREWANIRDELTAELAGGAMYPADVVRMLDQADQLPLAFDKAA